MSNKVNSKARASRRTIAHLLGGAAASMVCVTGCGGDENNKEAEVSRGIVSLHASLAQSSSYHLDSDDRGNEAGIRAAVSLGSIGLNAKGVLSLPEDAGSGSTKVTTRSLQIPRQSKPSKGCDCDNQRCEFKDCKFQGGLTLNGSFSWTKTSITCDYEIVISGSKDADEHLYHQVICSLDYGKDRVHGKLSTKGSYKGKYKETKYHSEWDLQMDFQEVEFDDYGRPKKGKVEVDATVVSHSHDQRLHGAGTIDLSEEGS